MNSGSMIRKIFICFVIFTIGINGLRRRCMNTGVLFLDKIIRSPIIVYGQSLGKEIYVETDTELLFNITFHVDCILKGENIENRIEITDAGIFFLEFYLIKFNSFWFFFLGIKTGRTACQWLDPGRFYVVFLEKFGLNQNTYCPLDFQERLVDDITYELLEKTCHLTRIPPIHSISNKCPNVSMTEFCPSKNFYSLKFKIFYLLDDDEIDVKIIPKGKYFDGINTNITKPKSGSLIDQYADNPHNHASSSILATIGIIILTVNVAMFI